MHLTSGLRFLAFVLALSAAAPAILASSGVSDTDLLLVVFLPSVLVGIATALYARRSPPEEKTWAYDSRRMP